MIWPFEYPCQINNRKMLKVYVVVTYLIFIRHAKRNKSSYRGILKLYCKHEQNKIRADFKYLHSYRCRNILFSFHLS